MMAGQIYFSYFSDIENVRAELGNTTAHLLGTYEQESKVDRLVREIGELSPDERRELLLRIPGPY
jgi:DNA-directed RNA polymerase specialized sigma24 family protein